MKGATGPTGITGQTGATKEELDKPRYGPSLVSLVLLASIFFH